MKTRLADRSKYYKQVKVALPAIMYCMNHDNYMIYLNICPTAEASKPL